MVLIEPVGIETDDVGEIEETELIVLIEPVGIETLSDRVHMHMPRVVLIEPVGIETNLPVSPARFSTQS